MTRKFLAKPIAVSPDGSQAEPAMPRFEHPKIICIDLPEQAVETVRAAGYRVVAGTLGQPYIVKRSDGVTRPQLTSTLPGFAEQEIVVVQHFPPDPAGSPPVGEPLPTTSEPTLWASCRSGVIDTRPFVARVHAQDDVQRILRYGGVVICFCSPRVNAGLSWGSMQYSGVAADELDISTWDLVPGVRDFHFDPLNGQEIQPLTGAGIFAPLTPHLQTARFFCTIESPQQDAQNWHALAKNKYDADVAGFFLPTDGKGLIVLLPQVKDPGAALQVLLDDILPTLVPKLFPESGKFAWRGRPPYELREVQALRTEIEEVRANAEVLEGELSARIDALRDQQGWVLDLLSGTGNELVDAVEKALRELGLPDVQKVDEADELRVHGRLREDIQVLGGSPSLLVEVKGLTTTPKEEDTLAVAKYIAPRMQEWGRTDVRGLAVINHQRGLPPLERENEHTFQADVLRNAQHQEFAVITGFDLFRLVMNKRQQGWPDGAVTPLFYENGRVGAVPIHYEFVGVVDHFYDKPNVVAIAVEGDGFAIGDLLGYELPVSFVEEEVTSIEVDGVAVEKASPGERVGMKTTLTKTEARSGLRVYRVSSRTLSSS
jgi:hypothetical protein